MDQLDLGHHISRQFNEELEDAPEAVNNDPYGDGWLIKITIDDASELEGLLSAAEYADMVGK